MVKIENKWMIIFGLVLSVFFFAHNAVAKMNSESFVIEDGESHEICVSLGFGENMNYSFIGGRELNFNIHYPKEGKKSFIVEEKLIKEVEHFFTAMVPQNYCMSWFNPNSLSATVNVIYDVR
jgi:hypothetical protein